MKGRWAHRLRSFGVWSSITFFTQYLHWLVCIFWSVDVLTDHIPALLRTA